jgi:5-methylcytosine-specific restriction endonuclease McrA
MTAMTLTVDSSAKPVGLIPMNRAVSQIASALATKATQGLQVLVSDPKIRYRSQHLDLPGPLVVMFPGFVELSELEAQAVSRRILFARDRYCCQYCGMISPAGQAIEQLTIDHVKPLHLFPNRRMATTWENCVSACQPCNNRKGGRLPRECGMMPRRVPRKPHYVQLIFTGRLNPEQRDYVADYFGDHLGPGAREDLLDHQAQKRADSDPMF